MFIHFNMNTFFPGWGNDRVDPKLFNPTALDARQWARAARSAGITYALLTTKHHDGFALWPSGQTPPDGRSPYTIAQSAVPTRDVVREYVDAFRAEGLLPGLYFSMWDVGNGVGGPYNQTDNIQWQDVRDYVLGQLTELLDGRYGEIPILVIDGYSWKMGHQQIPYEEIRGLVKRLQPNCLLVDHNGAIPWEVDLVYFEEPLGIQASNGNTWAALQGQTISGDWFWNSTAADPAQLKTLASLVEHLNRLEPLYTNFVLNCPPNRAGLFDPAIVARLAEIGRAWSPNLSRPPLPPQPAVIESPMTPVTVTATSGNARLAIDGLDDWTGGPRYQTLWQSAAPLPQSITLDLGSVRDGIDTLLYLPRREPGNTAGNVTSYRIAVSSDGVSFAEAASGSWPLDSSVKSAAFPAQSARYVRFDALSANGAFAVVGELAVGGRAAPFGGAPSNTRDAMDAGSDQEPAGSADGGESGAPPSSASPAAVDPGVVPSVAVPSPAPEPGGSAMVSGAVVGGNPNLPSSADTRGGGCSLEDSNAAPPWGLLALGAALLGPRSRRAPWPSQRRR